MPFSTGTPYNVILYRNPVVFECVHTRPKEFHLWNSWEFTPDGKFRLALASFRKGRIADAMKGRFSGVEAAANMLNGYIADAAMWRYNGDNDAESMLNDCSADAKRRYNGG